MPKWLNPRWLFTSSFNIKFAFLAVLFNGFLVGFVNRNYGEEKSISSALVQMFVSFLAGGIGARVVQYLSLIKNPYLSYFLVSALPIFIKLILAIIGHTLNQTPEFWPSVIWPILVSWVMSVGVNYGTRNLQQSRLGRFIFKPPSTS